MSQIETPERITDLPLSVVKSMISLSASGFGVVVALAWNELIQTVVRDYLDPYLGKNGGLISLFIYAVAVTLLAVVVTMQLVGLQKNLELLRDKVVLRRQAQLAKKATPPSKPAKPPTPAKAP